MTRVSSIYHQAEKVSWNPHPEAEGLMMKELLRLEDEGVTVRLHRIPLAGIPEHAHPHRHLIWVVSGHGLLWTGDVGERQLDPGVFVYVYSNVPHRFYGVKEEIEIYTISLAPMT